ncbi:PREDICTED: growth factor receptor-bound protein 14-like [Nicrophorus vespilloides]|uniref:Growth factor receptor-bound protein 14-like n=1 Tax=Nicrophorus vespilloides TaxID=110193 RepID=A0ABM1MES6_NICVS|nr:PREDICTED: growth factor receptor-bound protein 14-like [Nicrophorus vespilloides]
MDFSMLKRHDRNNTACKFPRLKCICVESASRYERLSEDGVYELSSIPEDRDSSTGDFLEFNFGPECKDSTNEKQEELLFYNDDGSFQSVVVERNLCASDLCQLLALKNRIPESINWCIIEHWPALGLERILEDHEYVLSAYRDLKTYSREIKYRFIFRKEYRKYEFFHDPQQFFPSDMIHNAISCNDGNYSSSNLSLHQMITQEGETPSIFSHMWMYDQYKNTWGKSYMLLKDKKLYYSLKVQSLAKFVRTPKSVNSISIKDDYGVAVYAKLSNYQVYATLNAKNQFRAPTEWGLCLRPVGLDSEDSEGTGLLCLACDSDKGRTCWLTAMRLAKYGKQLRENYRAFKNKQTESINPKDYNSFTVPNESVRSRVAMDFTGSVGRIVDDPKEAKAIAVAEGYSWKRRWRPSCRTQTGHVQGIESGVHITQPWFHSGMSRDQASALVSRHGTVDGVFLVRESRSNPGAFVLTYKFGGKVLHAQITPIMDPVREAHVFSLDSGVTKFYDLLQLVEFYQLNAGCLPTRLTHYVVQSTNIINNSSSNSNSPTGI